MSDLYTIVVEERFDTDLDGITGDADAYGMGTTLQRHFARGKGSFSACTLRITAAHPDADALDVPSDGLLHFVLSDCSEALQKALGGFDVINDEGFVPSPETSPLAYILFEAERDRARMRAWCPTELAPEADGSYDSAAHAVDRPRLNRLTRWPDMHRFPPPGLAGNVKRNSKGSPIAKSFSPVFDWKQVKRKGLAVADLQRLGDLVYMVSNKGAHVVELGPPFKAARLLKGPAKQSSTEATALIAQDDRLVMADATGAWTEIDPGTGKRSQANTPELPPRSDSNPLETTTAGGRRARIDAEGVLVIEGEPPVTIATGIVAPRCLLSTPDEETLLVSGASNGYLVHTPTRTLPLALPAFDHALWFEGKSPAVLLVNADNGVGAAAWLVKLRAR